MLKNQSKNYKANKKNKNNKNLFSKIYCLKMPKLMSHKWKKNTLKQPKNSLKKINLSILILLFIKKKNKFWSHFKKQWKKLNPKSIKQLTLFNSKNNSENILFKNVILRDKDIERLLN